MKVALYIDEGVEQIVLTPETASETAILGKLHDGDRDLTIARGGFYECQGGWVRQSASPNSSMLVLRPRIAPNPEGSN